MNPPSSPPGASRRFDPPSGFRMGPDRRFGPGLLARASPGPIQQPPGASRRFDPPSGFRMGPDRRFGPGLLARASPGPIQQPPGASRRQSKLPCAPSAHFGEFRLVVTDCERGESPLSHIPPKSPAANQRFAAICFLRARKFALNRRDAWSAGLRPASRGSAKPAPTTLATWSAGLRPASRGSANTCTDDAAPRQSHGLERRSLTGIARERETRTAAAAPPQCEGRRAAYRSA